MLDDGRPEAAEPQLRKALEFYRSVHADAYIRAAEALRRTYQALDAASGTDDR
jgi:hypothetical protein